MHIVFFAEIPHILGLKLDSIDMLWVLIMLITVVFSSEGDLLTAQEGNTIVYLVQLHSEAANVATEQTSP